MESVKTSISCYKDTTNFYINKNNGFKIKLVTRRLSLVSFFRIFVCVFRKTNGKIKSKIRRQYHSHSRCAG